MECDAVLVEGTCVVNESMLTGESIPITKIPVPDEDSERFTYDLQRQHVVFGGTEVLQGKVQGSEYCKAIVIRTGFMTTKGELVRAILFPPPLDFKFHSDFLKSIYVFLTLGCIGMSYSLWMWISNGVREYKHIIDFLFHVKQTYVTVYIYIRPILLSIITTRRGFPPREISTLLFRSFVQLILQYPHVVGVFLPLFNGCGKPSIIDIRSKNSSFLFREPYRKFCSIVWTSSRSSFLRFCPQR